MFHFSCTRMYMQPLVLNQGSITCWTQFNVTTRNMRLSRMSKIIKWKAAFTHQPSCFKSEGPNPHSPPGEMLIDDAVPPPAQKCG
jgi:hypothetical protein